MTHRGAMNGRTNDNIEYYGTPESRQCPPRGVWHEDFPAA